MKQFLAFLLLLFSTLCQAENGTVHLVLSESSPLLQKAADEIQHQLRQLGFEQQLTISALDKKGGDIIKSHDLIVTVGHKAADTLSQLYPHNHSIYSFIETPLLPATPAQHWVAVAINQPVRRLYDIAQTLVSGRYHNKIIIAVSEQNTALIKEIEAVKRTAGDQLELLIINEQTEPAKIIDKKLFQAGALVAVRDERIWSGENAKWMLYQSYKYGVPVVGYSKKFLKAGALVSSYASLAQTAALTAAKIIDWQRHKGRFTEEGIDYPDYEIEFNQHIARALEIVIPDSLTEKNNADVRD